MIQKKEPFLSQLSARVAFIFAASVVFFALGRPAFCEVPIGLSARGVDATYSLHNPFHLDMRDALGRPVSSRLVQKELKTAGAKARAKTQFFSALPKAKAVAFFMECLWKISSATLAMPSSWPVFGSLWALPAPGKQDLRVFERLLFSLFQVAGIFLSFFAVSFCKETSHRNFSLLRC